METTEVTLSLGAGSIKKLKALAMLTGRTVDQVEADLSETFDRMLSQSIRTLVAELDGDDEPVAQVTRSESVTEIHRRLPKQSFAALQAEAEAEELEKKAEEPEASADDHSLSGDDDTGETKSLEEQAADGTLTQEDLPVLGEMPNAGSDAEAFLDEALKVAATHLTDNHREPVRRAPSGAFDARRPRVSIQAHNGD